VRDSVACWGASSSDVRTSPGRPPEHQWIEAADNYARLHRGNDVQVVRETLAALEVRLDRCGSSAYIARLSSISTP
jgi:hypothetical protein